jgi:hypothetical protein
MRETSIIYAKSEQIKLAKKTIKTKHSVLTKTKCHEQSKKTSKKNVVGY